MAERYEQLFEDQLTAWISSACSEWGCATPTESLVTLVNQRIPSGIRSMIGLGIERGIVVPGGHTFSLKGLPAGKGPYKWFSHFEGRPNPNWEYYVHVAEYVRLSLQTENRDFQLVFEDDRMDIGIYHDGRLFVCCEAKETSRKAARLVSGLRRYQPRVPLTEPDRGKDSLRKAKYLIKNRPRYFYVVAIGARHEFRVTLTDEGFELHEDLIPLY